MQFPACFSIFLSFSLLGFHNLIVHKAYLQISTHSIGHKCIKVRQVVREDLPDMLVIVYSCSQEDKRNNKFPVAICHGTLGQIVSLKASFIILLSPLLYLLHIVH